MGTTITYITNCCSYNTKPTHDQLANKYQAILNDQQLFYRHSWHFKQDKIYHHKDKFIFFFNNYSQYQQKTSHVWEKVDFTTLKHGTFQRNDNDVVSLKWKYLIRKGAPLKRMREIVLQIFKLLFQNNQKHYQSLFYNIFGKGNVNLKNCPLFGSQAQCLQVAVGIPILNKDGYEALKRILWVIHKQFSEMEYNPLLIKVGTFLLLFVSQSQAYCVLQLLIKQSQRFFKQQKQNTLRWHFTFRRHEFKQCGEWFESNISELSNTLGRMREHLKRIGMGMGQFFQQVVQMFLMGMVPLSLIVRVWVMYLNQGMKIFFRIVYSILWMNYSTIIENHNPISLKQNLRKRTINIQQSAINQLIKRAFSLKLNKLTIHHYILPAQTNNSLYFPTLSHSSRILLDYHLQTLWNYLPENCKLLDPNLLWSTESDGFSFQSLMSKCQTFQNSTPIILIIKSTTNAIFGSFCNSMLQYTDNYVGDNDCFVFSLYARQRKYSSTCLNQGHLHVDREGISIGMGGKGIGLSVNANLLQGSSYECETYQNQVLHQQEQSVFEIGVMQVYYLK